MAAFPPRDQHTQELISRFQAKRARSRRMRLVAFSVVGVVFVAVIVAVVLLTVHATASQAGGSPPAEPGSGSSPSVVSSSSSTSSTPSTAVFSSSTVTSPGSPGNTTASTGGAGTAPSTTAGSTTTAKPTTTAGSTTTARSTTTTRPTTTTTASHPASSSARTQPSTKIVVIDPGHQAHGDPSLEPVGPGSSVMKPKVSDGTSGVATGIPESELDLVVGLKLRDSLQAHGVKVVMTRTSQNVNLSNIQRAQIANNAHADLFVRIHADGSTNPATSGIHVLYPAVIKGWTDDIAAASKRAASLAQTDLIAATGANNRGLDARTDMTGFNWSNVPVILPEIGFMTNAAEDRRLATAAYQDKIVQGLTRAILQFLGV